MVAIKSNTTTRPNSINIFVEYLADPASAEQGSLRPLIDEMLHGADGATADERAAVFRLAWDLVGSTLGGRGFLYERFYLTSAARNKQMLHTHFFDRTRSQALLRDMLSRTR